METPQQAVRKGKRRSYGARPDDDEPLPADCLLDNRDNLACLLRREDLGEDTVENIMKFAIEVDRGSFGRSLKMAIFKVFHESGFLRRGSALHRLCSGARIGGQPPALRSTTLHTVCTFMAMITRYHPIDVHGLLPAIEALVDRVRLDISRAKELLALYHTLLKQCAVRAHTAADTDWSQLPLLPLAAEIKHYPCGEKSKIPPEVLPDNVRVVHRYGSKAHYLDTYFRLLRHDCFGEFLRRLSALSQPGRVLQRQRDVFIKPKVCGVRVLNHPPGVTFQIKVEPV